MSGWVTVPLEFYELLPEAEREAGVEPELIALTEADVQVSSINLVRPYFPKDDDPDDRPMIVIEFFDGSSITVLMTMGEWREKRKKATVFL